MLLWWSACVFFPWHLWNTGTCWCAGSSEDLVCVTAWRMGWGGVGVTPFEKEKQSQKHGWAKNRRQSLQDQVFSCVQNSEPQLCHLRGVFNLSSPPSPSPPPPLHLWGHVLSLLDWLLLMCMWVHKHGVLYQLAQPRAAITIPLCVDAACVSARLHMPTWDN